MFAILALAAAHCGAFSVSLADAEALVLHAPNVRRAVVVLGARPAVELEDTAPKGWSLRVYATNGCRPGVSACSSLIDYYDVVSATAEVYNSSLDDRRVTSRELRRAQQALRRRRCG